MIHFLSIIVIVILAVTILASLSAWIRNFLTIIWLGLILFLHLSSIVAFAKVWAPLIIIVLCLVMAGIILESPGLIVIGAFLIIMEIMPRVF